MKLLNIVYEYAFDASVFTFTHPQNVFEQYWYRQTDTSLLKCSTTIVL